MTSQDARYDDPTGTDHDERDEFATNSHTDPVDGDSLDDKDGPVLLPVDTDSSDLRSDDDLAVDDKTDSDLADSDVTDSEVTDSDVTDSDVTDSDRDDAHRFDAEPTDSKLTDSKLTDSDSAPATDAISSDDAVSSDESVSSADSAFTDDSGSSVDSVTSASTDTATVKSDEDWHELQGRFVDDPEAAVREAGAWVEKALSDLRARVETGSTEDLRTAFRRYRDLHSTLN